MTAGNHTEPGQNPNNNSLIKSYLTSDIKHCTRKMEAYLTENTGGDLILENNITQQNIIKT